MGDQELPEPISKGTSANLTPELRAKFERKGEALVVHEILNYREFEKRQAAVDWLKERRDQRERRETYRFWAILLPAVIAAVAAVLGVFATKGWL